MTDDSTRCHGVTGSGTRCKKTPTDGLFCGQHPTSLVTKKGFAELQGAGPSAVSNWLADGKIEETKGGWIDIEQASASLEQTRDPVRPTMRHGSPDELVVDTEDVPRDVSDEDREHWGPGQWDELRKRSRALREEARAAKEQMERAEMEGRLVDADEVERSAFEQARALRTKILAVPDRLSAELAGATDSREVHSILLEELRACLAELAGEPGDDIREDGKTE